MDYFLLGVQSALWVIGFIGTLIFAVCLLIFLFGLAGSLLQWVAQR